MGWASSVGITIDRERAVPVGVQLEWGLRAAIERGELAAGDRLPPLRELADDVGAHLNTIRAVYARLEEDGLIDTRHGKGSFVRGRAEAAGTFEQAVQSAARTARTAGLTPQQLAAALYVLPAEDATADAERAERGQLRAQISALEATLSDLYREWPDLPPLPDEAARGPGPHLLTRDELVRQRDAVLARLLEVRAALAEPAPPSTDEPAPKEAARTVTRPGIAPA